MTRQGHDSKIRSRLATLLASAIAAAILLAPASAPAAVPRDFWSVAPQTTLTDADFDRMGQGLVGTVRIAVFWSQIDPGPDPGDNNWSQIDPVVAGAARNGIEVLPFLFGTPTWVAQGLDGKSCAPQKCALFPPKKGAALDAWKVFVGEFVDRYGSNGTFWTDNPSLPKLPVDAIQIWNEQNSASFFAKQPSPSHYAKLLAAAAEVIRAKDAAIQVVLGGMAELAGSKKATPASEYLDDLYKITDVENNFDGVAIHPYGASLDKVSSQVKSFRKVMKQAGDSGASLWVTEIGAGSKDGGNPLNRGKQGQAELLTDTFKYFEKKRNSLKIANVTWFSWMDSKVSICEWCATSGLFKKGLKEKPAWTAFTKFTGGS